MCHKISFLAVKLIMYDPFCFDSFFPAYTFLSTSNVCYMPLLSRLSATYPHPTNHLSLMRCWLLHLIYGWFKCLSDKLLHAFCPAASQVSAELCANSLKGSEITLWFHLLSSTASSCPGASVPYPATSSQDLSCSPSSLLGPAFCPAPPWAEQLSAGATAIQREQAAAIFHGVLKPAFSTGTTCRVCPGSCSLVFYRQTKCQVLIMFSWLSTLCSIKIGIFLWSFLYILFVFKYCCFLAALLQCMKVSFNYILPVWKN